MKMISDETDKANRGRVDECEKPCRHGVTDDLRVQGLSGPYKRLQMGGGLVSGMVGSGREGHGDRESRVGNVEGGGEGFGGCISEGLGKTSKREEQVGNRRENEPLGSNHGSVQVPEDRKGKQHKWNLEENKILYECFVEARIDGNRRNMEDLIFASWHKREMFYMKRTSLATRAYLIESGTHLLPEKEKEAIRQMVKQRHNSKSKAKVKQHQWTRKESMDLYECFVESRIDGTDGFEDRLGEIWRNCGGWDAKIQSLVSRAYSIRGGRYLSNIEKDTLEDKVIRKHKVETEKESEKESDVTSDIVCVDNVIGVDNGAFEITDFQLDDEQAIGIEVSKGNCERVEDCWKSDGVVKVLDDDMKMVLNRLREVFVSKQNKVVPSLKAADRKRVIKEVNLVDGLIHNIKVKCISEVNKLLYAGAIVVTERLGYESSKPGKKGKGVRKEPFWKRRIEGNLVKWRRDLSRIEELRKCNCVLDDKEMDRLERTYGLKENGHRQVVEELKMKIRAGSCKVRYYVERKLGLHQNNLFRNDQSRLFKELDGDEKGDDDDAPDGKEATEFWSGIWSSPGTHNKDVAWLKRVKDKLKSVKKQGKVKVTIEDVVEVIKRMSNWKAPGPDGVQGFWFKKFRNLHPAIRVYLEECVESGNVPDWLVKGRTVLIMKDRKKGKVASNYRPIACLPLMWKLLSGIFAEKIYGHLKANDLLPDEQKGCRKQSRGTKDQLLIDKTILKESRRLKKNLAMAWIDYKKAYDMVPHSWLKEIMRMMGVSDNVERLLSKSMGQWCTELESGGKVLGTVRIRRGIFQGDSLSPLLFVMVMTPLTMILKDESKGYKLAGADKVINHLLFMDDLKVYAKTEQDLDLLVNVVKSYTDDIGMKFGMDKCAILVLKGGKKVSCKGLELPDGEVMKEVDENGYKYLGIVEADCIMNRHMKDIVKAEYIRRVRKLAKSRLNAGNLFKGINAWAIGVVRYTAGILDWSKGELKDLDVYTRKTLTMNNVFHRKSNVDRLYLKRNEGGRGLISVEECVGVEERALSEYVRNSDEWMLKEVAKADTMKEMESAKDYQEQKHQERADQLSKENKPLHGQFFTNVKDVADNRSWEWLKAGYLTKSTEAYVCAAQEQVLRTNHMRAVIYKEKVNGEMVSKMCRKCGEKVETVMHLTSSCKALASVEYLARHDKVGLRIHWELCKKYDIECAKRWFDHVPQTTSTSKDGQIELLWNQKQTCSKGVEHNWPDLMIRDHRDRKLTIVDFSIPNDCNVAKKEDDKIRIYQPLAADQLKMYGWKKREIVPIIVGALGTIPKRLGKHLKMLGIPDVIGGLQMTAILGTVRILRDVLGGNT